jgi:hypothetical protein
MPVIVLPLYRDFWFQSSAEQLVQLFEVVVNSLFSEYDGANGQPEDGVFDYINESSLRNATTATRYSFQ